MFAALQCRVRFGVWSEQQAQSVDSLNLLEYVPLEYVKHPRLSKSIMRQWRSLGSITTLAAKRQYIALVRALPTYGFTFFVVDKLPPQRHNNGGLSELSQLLSSHSALADNSNSAAGVGGGGSGGSASESFVHALGSSFGQSRAASSADESVAVARTDGSSHLLLGVGETHVQFLHPTLKKVLLTYPLARLHKWHVW